jgi:hypothetical protein
MFGAESVETLVMHLHTELKFNYRLRAALMLQDYLRSSRTKAAIDESSLLFVGSEVSCGASVASITQILMSATIKLLVIGNVSM